MLPTLSDYEVQPYTTRKFTGLIVQATSQKQMCYTDNMKIYVRQEKAVYKTNYTEIRGMGQTGMQLL